MVTFFARGDGVTTGVEVATGVGLSEGVATGAGTLAWVNFTWIVGEENWKFFALNEIQPSFSLATEVATSFAPSDEITEIVALIGALEKP